MDFIKREDFNSFSLQIHSLPTYFQIRKKEDILCSLDKIGINEKTIWCDFDHIASYIKKKAKGSIHV